MENIQADTLSEALPLQEKTLLIQGQEEIPTREEFYTSYPFFKYWKGGNAAQALAPAGINIYMHIPFCKQICDYCFYMKELVKSKSQVDQYVDSLCEEIRLVSEMYGLKNRRVDSIYIGGGTPSVLTEQQFRKVIDTLHKYHTLDKPEFTFEAEPGTFTRTKLLWYKENGVTRISMGVQSFVDSIIQLSNRHHTAAQAINSIAMVKEEGGFSINVDLLSGLAGENMDTWNESLNIAMAQPLDMLTIYKMKAYSNTVFFKKGVHKDDIKLPDANEEIGYMRYALHRLQDSGFQRWTTFAFTNNAYRHKYLENTWRGEDLIAYGASAFGKIGNVNYQNINDITSYCKKVSEKQMPVYRTYKLSYKDRIVKELLLCSARLSSYSKKEFIEKFGFDYFNLVPDVIKELKDKGYITDNTEELCLTEQGVLFGDFVSKVLASSVKNVLGKDNIGFIY